MAREKVKKIDVHVHATMFQDYIPNLLYNGDKFLSDTQQIELFDKLNIEKGVLLPIVSQEWQIFQSCNGEVKTMVNKNPDRFLWFCNIDPRNYFNDPNTDFSKMLNFYKELGAKGLGELTPNMMLDDPLLDNLFYHCEKCDMPVTIHLAPASAQYGYYGIKDDPGMPRLERVLKKFPNLKIFGHSQQFWAEISAQEEGKPFDDYPTGKVKEGRIAQLLREYPNLYCDVSANSGMNAFTRDKEYAAKFIEEFSDRIMYGTDYCQKANTFVFAFDKWLDEMCEDKMISEENYYKFMRGNAERLLNLK